MPLITATIGNVPFEQAAQNKGKNGMEMPEILKASVVIKFYVGLPP
jgi:hypothetical protein